MFSEVELNILIDIYEMDIDNGSRLHNRQYDFVEQDVSRRNREMASYLKKFERLGYISLEEGVFVTGGMTDDKYRNNVIMYFDEKIHIEEKGINLVNEVRKTVFDKVKEEGKDILTKVYGELKDWGTKTITEVFIKLSKGQ